MNTRDRIECVRLLRELRLMLPWEIHQTAEQREADRILRDATIYIQEMANEHIPSDVV